MKLSHRLEYAAFRAVTWTVGRLPLGAATRILASAARGVGMRVGVRKRAEKNLAHAMPELSPAVRKSILTEMFDQFARTATEYRYLPQLMADETAIEIEGLEHLIAARDAGKGAVLATGHFGNWEAVRIAFARNGWPPALIYRAFNNPPFDAHAQKMISAIDAPVFHKGRKGSLGLVRHIKQGGAGLILADQRFSRAPRLPFFGKPAETSLGAAEIAKSYGAMLLPVRGERLGRSSQFRVVVEAPIATDGCDASDVMTEVNARLESWVRAKPEQYFWMHNRWGKAAVRIASAERDQ